MATYTTYKKARGLAWGLPVIALCLLLFAEGTMAVTTIRFNYRSGGVRDQLVNAWITAFEAQNPDVNVEWEAASGAWMDKLLVEMAAGTAPDVTEFWGDFAQKLAREGLLLDLRPYVERDMTAEDVADFFPALWRTTFIQFGPRQGVQFSLPRYINTMVTFYNETAFAEAGLETPDSLHRRGEWTWEALREAAIKLTRRDNENRVLRYGFMTNVRSWSRMAQWLWEAGGDFFDPEDPTRFIGDQAGATYAIDYLHELIWGLGVARNNLNPPDFINGTVAMADEGIHAIFNEFDAGIGDAFDWNMVVRPAGPNGRKPWAVDDAFGIWSGTQKPDEAWRFLKFLASREGQEIMSRIEGLAPPRRSAADVYLSRSDRLNLGVFVESMAEAQVGIAARVAGDTLAIGRALQAALDATLLNNQKPWVQAAQEAKTVIEGIIRETAR